MQHNVPDELIVILRFWAEWVAGNPRRRFPIFLMLVFATGMFYGVVGHAMAGWLREDLIKLLGG